MANWNPFNKKINPFHHFDPYGELIGTQKELDEAWEEIRDLKDANQQLTSALDNTVTRLKELELILTKHRFL